MEVNLLLTTELSRPAADMLARLGANPSHSMNVPDNWGRIVSALQTISPALPTLLMRPFN